MLHTLVSWVVETVSQWGYLGIFAVMFLESSFFPFPSEVIMIPAGYLAYQGEMNIYLAIAVGTFGSLAGALLNYYLAAKYGKNILLKYGKYVLLKPQHLEKLESFFQKHGEISTFTGRLIMGVRQYISLPAGLSRMNLPRFILFTTLGALIWVTILAYIGYYLGANQDAVASYLSSASYGSLVVVALIILIYYIFTKKRSHE